MKIKNMVAVSGESSLFELITTKSNGLLLKDPVSQKTKFYSVRLHQFTPLETVSIYTMEDACPIKQVFETMHDKKSTLTIPTTKDANPLLHQYFAQILPDYDVDKVYASDIKKVIKWYGFLDKIGYTNLQDEVDQPEAEVETTPVVEEVSPVVEEKIKKKTSKK